MKDSSFSVDEYHRMIRDGYFAHDERFELLDGLIVRKIPKDPIHEAVVGGFAGPLSPILVVILIAGLGLVPMLLQYHCLDCGGSGRLTRWRKHICYVSVARRDVGRRRRFRGPTPPHQILIWFWVVMAAILAFNAADLPRLLP